MSPFTTWAIWTKDHTAITKEIRLANHSEPDFLYRPSGLESEPTIDMEVHAGDPNSAWAFESTLAHQLLSPVVS
jgi:hypothetical protein